MRLLIGSDEPVILDINPVVNRETHVILERVQVEQRERDTVSSMELGR